MKVRCPDCNKKYRLKGRPRGPSIKCPRCSGIIPVPKGPEPSRSALREELSRLAAGQDEEARPRRTATRIQVTNPEEDQFFSTRGRVMFLIASILFALLLLGGGAAWLVVRLGQDSSGQGGMPVVVGPQDPPDGGAPAETTVQPQPPGRLPADVLSALRRARTPVPPCQEERAIEQWRTVLRLLRDHEDIAGERIAEAERRIASLSETINERRETVDELQSRLEGARARAEAGEETPAREQVREVLQDIGRLRCRDPRAEQVRQGAVALQKKLSGAEAEESGRRTGPPPIVDDPEYVLDKPAPGTEDRWQGHDWANRVDVELKGRGEDLYRSLVHKRGSKKKWVVTMNRPIDLTDCKFLVMDMKVQEPVRVALGVWVANDLYESRDVALPKKDEWQSVVFNLKSDDYKCADTNWTFGARIDDPKAVTRFSLFFYSQARFPILFANVRLHKGD